MFPMPQTGSIEGCILMHTFLWNNSLQGQSEQVRAALHVPHIKRDCLLTTALGSAASLVEELRLGPVNRTRLCRLP